MRPAWHERAKCFSIGVDHFFTNDEGDSLAGVISSVRRATRLCDACPVFSDCLRWALENREKYGVWAKTSGRKRKEIWARIDRGETTVDEVVKEAVDGERTRTGPEPGGARLRSARAG